MTITKFKTFIFFFTLALLASCGGTKDHSNAKFEIDISALTGSAASATGGLMLVGHKTDDSVVFSRGYKVGEEDPVLELSNGEWEFYLAYWQGTNLLEGLVKCSYSGRYNFTGGDAIVTFAMGTSDCAALPDGTTVSEDLDPNYSNTWPSLNIRSCLGDPEFCTFNGITKSFRIKISSENKNFQQAGVNDLGSICYTDNGSVNSTLVRVPTGSASDGGGIFKVEVQLFTESDCTGSYVSYNHEALKKVFNESNHMTFYNYTSGTVTLNLTHNAASPVTTEDIPFLQFGSGSDGSSAIAPIYASVRDFPSASSITVGSSSGFSEGDEIMWYVTSENGTGACGGVLKTGHYGFRRIQNISGNNITFFNLFADNLSTLQLPAAANLDPASNFCIIQITKVVNYSSLTLDTAGIIASTYDSSSGMGGILALRVKDTLELKDNSYLKATATGFMTNSPYTDYTHCASSTIPCLQMGRGDGSYRGGGITFVAARRLRFSNSAGGALVYASADTSGSGDGGSVRVISDEIRSDTYVLNNSFIYANGFSSGNSGFASVYYCQIAGDSALIPSYGQTLASTAPNSSLEVYKNSRLCP